jgi:glycosyltransferase involved in cell wall biosynthesis
MFTTTGHRRGLSPLRRAKVGPPASRDTDASSFTMTPGPNAICAQSHCLHQNGEIDAASNGRATDTTKSISIWESLPRDTKRAKVSVVIPALNEARNLPYIAVRMPHDIDEIVFVDGASVDNSAEVARDLWPGAVHIAQTRKGKGNALASGFAAASGDIIVMIDADGSTDPAEIPKYVGALLSGADFAKGSRFLQGGGSADITKFRRLGNKGLKSIVNILFATEYTDLCYGYNAFWRHCLEVMKLPDIGVAESQWGDGFEVETMISIRLAASRLKIVEVCSYESNRIHGVSNLNAFTDGLRVARTIRQEFLIARAERKLMRSGAAMSGLSDLPRHAPSPETAL